MIDKYIMDIRNKCKILIDIKNVNLYDLSFELGLDYNKFIKTLNSNVSDNTIYLKMYNILLGW